MACINWKSGAANEARPWVSGRDNGAAGRV